MNNEEKINITVEATINAPIEKVWKLWITPKDICKWNSASADWHTTISENYLRVGGKFTTRMEAKDGSIGFDFWGIYDEVKTNELIAYTMGAAVVFTADGESTKLVETFEAETQNTVELQRSGWQAILDSFKNYAENN